MVAINPYARALAPAAFPAQKTERTRDQQTKRGAYLANCYQLTDELAAASTFAEPVGEDDEPDDPSPAEQARIAAVILAATKSIRRAKPRDESQTFRVDPSQAALAKRLLESGMKPAAVRAETGLGRKALETIRRGGSPRTLNVCGGEVHRCAGCGGRITTDECMLCAAESVGRG